jgi:hypothetical protein
LIFHVKVSLAKRRQTELFLPLKLIKKLVRPQKALTFEEYSPLSPPFGMGPGRISIHSRVRMRG